MKARYVLLVILLFIVAVYLLIINQDRACEVIGGNARVDSYCICLGEKTYAIKNNESIAIRPLDLPAVNNCSGLILWKYTK